MSEYNPFEDSMPGKGLHEINNAPKENASAPTAASTAASTATPPYVPPPNPPYEPYVPTQAVQQPYQPTPAQGVTPPPGSSIHYSAGQNAYAGAPAVRYDLAGNPLPPEPVAPPQQQYAPPQSPYGAPPPQQPYGYAGAPAYGGAPQAPYGAPQGAWPPPGQTGSATFAMQENNTSGQQGTVPPEIEGLHWNWGAYFLPILWCRWHGMTGLAGLLSATAFCVRLLRYMPSAMHPVFGATYGLFWLVVSVYMGLNGHKMGWRNRRYFGGVQEHLQVQRAWLVGGVLAGPIITIAATIFFVSVQIASRPSPATYGAGSSYNSPAGGEFGDGSTQTPQGLGDSSAPQSGFTGDNAPQPGFTGNNAPQPSFNGGGAPQPSFNGPASAPPPPASGVPTD